MRGRCPSNTKPSSYNTKKIEFHQEKLSRMKKKERNTLFRGNFLFRSCLGFSSDSLLGGKERGVAGLKASALAAGAPSGSHLRPTPPDPVIPGRSTRKDCIERPKDLLLFTAHDGKNPQRLSTLRNTRGKWSMSNY